MSNPSNSRLAADLVELFGPADSLTARTLPSGLELMLVAGELVPGGKPDGLTNIDPTTGESLGTVGSATADDLDRAIAAARHAADAIDWGADLAFRQHCLRQLAAGIREHTDAFVQVLVAELGCAVRVAANIQVGPVADKIEQVADRATACLATETLPEIQIGPMRHSREIRHEPIGVIGAITPWNIPLDIMAAKVAGALAAGNTLILKPSPETPWVGNLLGRVIAECTDIPDGVVSILTSADHTLGAQLVADPRVDAVSFTGSTATGRKVYQAAAEDLKKVHLELGGKSPSIVVDDESLEQNMPIAAALGCFNAGQSCILPSRLLVPESRLDECLELAATGLGAVVTDHPADAATFMGPLVSDAHRQRVAAMVSAGVAESGRVVVGGTIDRDRPGFFYPPTLVADAAPDSTLVQDEVFGPVVVVQAYHDLDHAIELANGTKFGLAGYVWGADPEVTDRFASSIRAGMIGVNGGNFTGGDMPFGGVGHSGLGREWGAAGISEFTEIKTVSSAHPA